MQSCAAILLVICLAQTSAVADVLPRLRVASAVSAPGVTAALGGSAPVVSADGRRVAFLSRSPNLVPNLTSGELNVFLRLVGESNTVLVSRSLSGVGGNDHSVLPSLSSNGNLVAFQSAADNLVSNDTNGAPDVFLYDVTTHGVHLVSSNAHGNPAAGASTFPLISADGRFVVFESAAPDLAPATGASNLRNIFRADLLTGDMQRVSVPGAGGPEGACELQTITPDGRFVVFHGTFTPPGSNAPWPQLYVRDMNASVPRCLTDTLNLFFFSQRRFLASITADGRYVAFRDLNSDQDATPSGNVYRTDLLSGTRLQITNSTGAAGSGLAISSDGNKIIFPAVDGLFLADITAGTNQLLVSYPQGFSHPGNISTWIPDFIVDAGFTRLIYFLNRATNATTIHAYDLRFSNIIFSASSAVPSASLSPSGQFLAYEVADDLATNDMNGASDIYLHDFNILPHYVTTRLVTQAQPTLRETTGRGFSTLLPGSLSAAGDRILFLSTDSSFVRNDTNYFHDMFAHDYRTNASWSAFPFRSNRTWNAHGPLIPASATSTNLVSLSNSAHAISISADGAFAAFVRSTGDQTIGGPTNIFRADLQSGAVSLIAPDGASPSISEDGRRVAYELALATTSTRQIEVRDFVHPASFTASIRFDGSRGGNASSWAPQLTLNGRWAVFLSLATDLVQPELFPAAVRRIFARDLDAGRTRLVSNRNNSPFAQASNFIISANGRYVIFSLGTALYRHDLRGPESMTNALVCSNCINPSATADGQLVTFQSTAKPSAILLADLERAVIEVIAPSAYEGAISQNGRFIVFTSRSSDLVPNDANGASDVFLRDRWRGVTHLLSATPSGSSGNGPSAKPIISADARRIAFQSFASDLVPGDFNNHRDVFFVVLEPPNSDDDYLDDDWEEHHFGNLARTGPRDFDDDGYADATEQTLGSNPLDPSSNLRVVESGSVPIGTNRTRRVTLTWNSAPGNLYRLQLSTNLNSWMTIPSDIIPGGPTATAIHIVPNPPAAFFYRVTNLE